MRKELTHPRRADFAITRVSHRPYMPRVFSGLVSNGLRKEEGKYDGASKCVSKTTEESR